MFDPELTARQDQATNSLRVLWQDLVLSATVRKMCHLGDGWTEKAQN